MDAILAATPLLLFLAVIYVFGVLPRQRKMAKHAALIRGLEVNDVVTTSGGIRGRVIGRKGPLIMVEVAPGVVFDVEPAKVDSVSERMATGRPNGCPRCGSPIDPDDQFCGDCGAPANGAR